MLAMGNDEVIGRARGGQKRAEVLSPDQRRDIATKAAAARWGAKALQATHKGSFKEEFGIDVECYVLNDPQKTAVISQSGMGKALGLSPRGNAFPRFLASKAMAGSVSAQLAAKIEQPLKFQWSTGGAQPPSTVNGFDVTLLVDVCKAIAAAEAEGKLHPQQEKIARQAHIILAASAKAGIKGLVYALAGYNPGTQEVIDAFKLYVREEAKKYESEFPNELYLQWHRLYEIPIPERGKPWHFKNLTVKHIYFPLAKSRGKLFALLKALKAKDGDRQTKLFQFLNDIGARALRMQLGRVLEMCESSPDRATYEAKIVERFGGQQELEFVPISSSSSGEDSNSGTTIASDPQYS
jgi:hypothetical protein